MEIYLVGGAVRDELLSQPVKDRDWVVVGSTPEELLQQGYKQVGKDFPVFLHPESKEEYALARTETKSGKGYGGFVCEFNPSVTLEEDLKRRDLTINAIAKSEQGDYIDPHQGVADIKAKQLRHVSSAFKEDPLRVLRVARFAARYNHLGFQIATETQELMSSMCQQGMLDELTAERVWLETVKAMKEPSPHIYFSTLANCGGLTPWFQAWQTTLKIDTDKASLAQSLLNAAIKTDSPQTSDIENQTKFRLVAFASLFLAEASAFFKKLKAPKQYIQLSKTQHKYYQQLVSVNTPVAEEMHELLKNINAFRQPEKVAELTMLFHILANAHGFQHWNYDLMQQALEKCLAVNPEELIQTGVQGAELGKAIESKRIKLIEEILEQA